MILAVAVTILSLGIALCSMAVVIERQWLWAAGLIFGATGTIGLDIGTATMLGKCGQVRDCQDWASLPYWSSLLFFT